MTDAVVDPSGDDSEKLAGRERLGRRLGLVAYLACLLVLIGSLPSGSPLSFGEALLCCWGVLPAFFVTRQLVFSLSVDRTVGQPKVSFPDNPLLRWSTPDWWQRNKVGCLVFSILFPPCWMLYGLLGSVPLLPFILGAWPGWAGLQVPALFVLWVLGLLIYALRTPAVTWIECDLPSRLLIRHVVRHGCQLRSLVSKQPVVRVGVNGVWVRAYPGADRALTEPFAIGILEDGSHVQLQAAGSLEAVRTMARKLASRLLIPFQDVHSSREAGLSHWEACTGWTARPTSDGPPVC